MAASMTLIAKEAGVSRPLVSRLLNNDSTLRVGDETKERVLKTIDRLGGIKRRQAASRKTGTIVLPVNSLLRADGHNNRSGLYNKSLEIINDYAASKKIRFSIMLFNDEDKIDFFRDLCAPSSFCSGIFLTTSIVDQNIANLLLRKKFPHICVDPMAEIYEINTVSGYFLSGFRKALSHLQELGHSRIGYLGPQRSHYPAFLSAMFELGLECTDDYNCKYDSPLNKKNPEDYRKASAIAFGNWIDDGGTATAIICHNDFGALGAIDAMQARGMTPGREISLIGVDNIEEHLKDFTESPGLTTIDNHRNKIYRHATAMLCRQIIPNRKFQTVNEHIPLDLIVRTTTGTIMNSG